MVAVPFDTLALARKLRDEAKLPQEQAEGVAKALGDVMSEEIAAKSDIRDVRRDIESVRRDVAELEIRLKHDLTLRLGAMMAASIAIIAALVKIL
ncbi:MAG: hypothetical protein FJX54_16595 [Alphaproteobacteria bacterium]|nr:hypothetical protein [Alphaproteobacteria bacterium]